MESFATDSLVDTIDEDFFNTYIPNVTNLRESFENTELVSFPNNTFRNLPKVTSLRLTFAETPLNNIPVDAFKESSLNRDLEQIFYKTDITSVPSGLFDTHTLNKSLYYSFASCVNLTTIPSGLFDSQSNVTWARGVFESCSSLATIPNGLFDYMILNESLAEAFRYSGITEIPLGLLDNSSSLVFVDDMFRDCKGLYDIDENIFINNLNIKFSKATFRQSSIRNTVKLNHLDKLESVYFMYYNCVELVDIRLDLVKGLSNLKNAEYLFYSCRNENLANNVTSSGDNVFILPSDFFDGCDSLETLIGWRNVSRVYLKTDTLTFPTSLVKAQISLAGGGSYNYRGGEFSENIPNIFEGNTNDIDVEEIFTSQTTFTGFIYRFWRDNDLSFSNTTDAFKETINAVNYPEIPLDWGGTIGTSNMVFNLDINGGVTVGSIVNNDDFTSYLWFNGNNTIPQVGDVVWEDYLEDNPFDGQNLFYNLDGDSYIQVDSNGVVINIGRFGSQTKIKLEVFEVDGLPGSNSVVFKFITNGGSATGGQIARTIKWRVNGSGDGFQTDTDICDGGRLRKTMTGLQPGV